MTVLDFQLEHRLRCLFLQLKYTSFPLFFLLRFLLRTPSFGSSSLVSIKLFVVPVISFAEPWTWLASLGKERIELLLHRRPLLEQLRAIHMKFVFFLLYHVQLGVASQCRSVHGRGVFGSALHVRSQFVALRRGTASFQSGGRGAFASALYMRSPFVASRRNTMSCQIGGASSRALHVYSLLSRRVTAAYRTRSRHPLASPVRSCDTCRTRACLHPKHCVELASAAEGATTAKPDALERWAEGKDGGRRQGAREPTGSCAIGCLRRRRSRRTWSSVSLDALECRCGRDMENPGDDGMRGLPRLSPHRRLCGRLRP